MHRKAKKKGRVSTVATFLFLPLVLALLFAMGVVRTSCMNKGYEISRLATNIDERKLEFEMLETERSNILNKENLYTIASQKGFIFRQEGRTYNVR